MADFEDHLPPHLRQALGDYDNQVEFQRRLELETQRQLEQRKTEDLIRSTHTDSEYPEPRLVPNQPFIDQHLGTERLTDDQIQHQSIEAVTKDLQRAADMDIPLAKIDPERWPSLEQARGPHHTRDDFNREGEDTREVPEREDPNLQERTREDFEQNTKDVSGTPSSEEWGWGRKTDKDRDWGR